MYNCVTNDSYSYHGNSLVLTHWPSLIMYCIWIKIISLFFKHYRGFKKVDVNMYTSDKYTYMHFSRHKHKHLKFIVSFIEINRHNYCPTWLLSNVSHNIMWKCACASVSTPNVRHSYLEVWSSSNKTKCKWVAIKNLGVTKIGASSKHNII